MKWRIKERAESGRAGCKTKERPLRQIRAGDPSDDGTAPQPGAGAAEQEKHISSPVIIPKKRLGRKDFPGIFYFIGMKNSVPEHRGRLGCGKTSASYGKRGPGTQDVGFF